MKTDTHKKRIRHKSTVPGRNLLIDIWRIIATLLILKHHTYYMDLAGYHYHFRQARLYVEFFFLLSGYFTYLHFQKCSYTNINDMAKESIRYTYKKWTRFLPYVIPAVIVQYILNQIVSGSSTIDFLHTLEGMPRDLLLLTAVSGTATVGPLWYLSAMILAMPLLGMCFQLIPKYLMLILATISALLYYGVTLVSGTRAAPHDFIRGFFCMVLGILIACLAEEMEKRRFRKILALLLGEICLFYTVLSTYSSQFSDGYGWTTVVMAFVFGISLLLYHGNIAFPAGVRKAVMYLCDLSFVMYVWQRATATTVLILAPKASDHFKVACYFAATLILSVIIKFVTEKSMILAGKYHLKSLFFE